MAKKGQVIAITTILAAITIIAFGVSVLGKVFDQGGKHAAQEARVNTICEEVKIMKPKVNELDRKVLVIETKQQAILTGIEKIQKKLEIE